MSIRFDVLCGPSTQMGVPQENLWPDAWAHCTPTEDPARFACEIPNKISCEANVYLHETTSGFVVTEPEPPVAVGLLPALVLIALLTLAGRSATS